MCVCVCVCVCARARVCFHFCLETLFVMKMSLNSGYYSNKKMGLGNSGGFMCLKV